METNSFGGLQVIGAISPHEEKIRSEFHTGI